MSESQEVRPTNRGPDSNRERWPVVYHFVGTQQDAGGILSTVRQFSKADFLRSVTVVGPDFEMKRRPYLHLLYGPRVSDETIGPKQLGHALFVALGFLPKLKRRPRRWFHGHSRFGMLVAFWLHVLGYRRTLASVHCYGHHQWLYRFLARVMGPRLVWLSPQMKRHYRQANPDRWDGCVPEMAMQKRIEAPMERKVAKAKGVVEFAYLGFITPRKQLDVFLEAMRLLSKEERTQVFLHVLGNPADNDMDQAFDRKVRELASGPLADRVQFHGWMSAPWEFLRERMDWLAMPSKNEPFALAILETLQEGFPVLGSDTGGIPDVIEPGVNGYLFRAGDAGDLARVLRKILNGEFQGEAEVIRRSAEPFTPERVLQRWKKLYRSLDPDGFSGPGGTAEKRCEDQLL